MSRLCDCCCQTVCCRRDRQTPRKKDRRISYVVASEDDRDHYAELGAFLKFLYKRDHLTDAQISVQHEKFHAHRVVLACHSEFFSDLFGDLDLAINSKLTKFVLDDIKPRAFSLLLDYYYSSSLKLTFENYSDVRQAAVKLGTKEIIDACDKFMSEKMSHKKRMDSDAELQIIEAKPAKDVVVRNFLEITSSDSFLPKPVDAVCGILADVTLLGASEAGRFQAGCKWLCHDLPSRKQYASKILKHVDFTKLSTQELFKCIEKTPFLMDDEETRKLIVNSHWYKAPSGDKASELTKVIPPVSTQPRSTKDYVRLRATSYPEATLPQQACAPEGPELRYPLPHDRRRYTVPHEQAAYIQKPEVRQQPTMEIPKIKRPWKMGEHPEHEQYKPYYMPEIRQPSVPVQKQQERKPVELTEVSEKKVPEDQVSVSGIIHFSKPPKKKTSRKKDRKTKPSSETSSLDKAAKAKSSIREARDKLRKKRRGKKEESVETKPEKEIVEKKQIAEDGDHVEKSAEKEIFVEKARVVEKRVSKERPTETQGEIIEKRSVEKRISKEKPLEDKEVISGEESVEKRVSREKPTEIQKASAESIEKKVSAAEKKDDEEAIDVKTSTAKTSMRKLSKEKVTEVKASVERSLHKIKKNLSRSPSTSETEKLSTKKAIDVKTSTAKTSTKKSSKEKAAEVKASVERSIHKRKESLSRSPSTSETEKLSTKKDKTPKPKESHDAISEEQEPSSEKSVSAPTSPEKPKSDEDKASEEQLEKGHVSRSRVKVREGDREKSRLELPEKDLESKKRSKHKVNVEHEKPGKEKSKPRKSESKKSRSKTRSVEKVPSRTRSKMKSPEKKPSKTRSRESVGKSKSVEKRPTRTKSKPSKVRISEKGDAHAKKKKSGRLKPQSSLSKRMLETSESSETTSSSPQRSSVRFKEVPNYFISLLGGVNPQIADPKMTGNHFWTYDPAVNKWSQRANLPDSLSNHGVAVFGPFIFVIGGTKIKSGDQKTAKNMPVKTAFRYDVRSKLWTNIAKMREPRMNHECVALGDRIFAIGGRNTKMKVLDSVECYNPMSNKWTPGPSFHHARIGFAVAVHNHQIFMVGGLAANRTISNHVEVYSNDSDQWVEKRPLEHSRATASLCHADGRLYLIGGAAKSEKTHDKITHLPDVEVYDDASDTWEYRTSMKHLRTRFVVASSGSRIYIMGGMREGAQSDYVLEVECYDTAADYWLPDIALLPEKLVGMKPVVHKKPKKHE